MSFRKVVRLFDYWQRCPPVHLLVRGYMGYEPRKRHEQFDDQAAMAALGQGSRKKKLADAPLRVQQMAESVKNIKHG